MIKITIFYSSTPEEWIIIADLVQNVLVGQNVTTSPPIYKCIERVLKGDAKAEFLQQINLVVSCVVANFTFVMATMTVYVFSTYAYCDQRLYIQRNLRKPPEMKAHVITSAEHEFLIFSTRLSRSASYISS